MKTYNVRLTLRAEKEKWDLHDYLFYSIKAPLTAKRYIDGLEKELRRLERLAGIIKTDINLSQRFGYELKRTNYKKIAIIYSIEDDIVYIHHIIPQSLL